MKSPSVPVVAMKETQPELWFSLEDQREKRWRKYATDGLMPIRASQVYAKTASKVTDLGCRWMAWIPLVSKIARKKGENGGTKPAKIEKRKKGCAIVGRVSRGAQSCQMRVVPHSLFLLPTISRTV
jgi:hypothetical protein